MKTATFDVGTSSTVELSSLLDRLAIEELVRLERFWRDQAQWDKLTDSYIEDSWVCTTWFRGTARQFSDASRDMRENRNIIGKHEIAPTRIQINGDRALSESMGKIWWRYFEGNVEVDMVQNCRFFSRVVRTDRSWKMASFDGIYVKDTLTPVNTNERPPIDWDLVARIRPSYRFLAYGLAARGYQIPDDLTGDDRPDIMSEFYRKAEHWLATGEKGA